MSGRLFCSIFAPKFGEISMTHDENLVQRYAEQNGFNHFDDLFEQVGRHVFSLSLLDDNGDALPIGMPVFVEIHNGVVFQLSQKQYDEVIASFDNE